MPDQTDPIQFEVIRNALLEATEEMAIALRRSAYSTNIKTRADFSCAFFDRQLRPVAQAFTQPVHLGSLTILTPRAVAEYGPENLQAGDAILVNDPYRGGVHLNDITLISPVYCGDGTLRLCSQSRPSRRCRRRRASQHWSLPAGVSGGHHHPSGKASARRGNRDDVFELVIAQIRSKRETRGDFRAQVAANHSGIRRLNGLVEQVGLAQASFYMDRLIDYTRERTLAELAKLPKGEFTATGVVDNDGFTDEPVRLQVRVIIDEEGVLFDLTGCDPQRRAPVNSTYSQTFAACAYVLKCLIDQDVPVNAGFYEQVRLVAPEGTVVNCTAPSPVVGGWETQVRLSDIILKALHPALPDTIPAATKGTMCQVGFGGTDPRTGQLYSYYETMAGGYGGRSTKDGPDAVQCHGQNTENAPIEEIEINYPLRIDRYELIEDSEGAGQYRGGLGLRRDYRFIDHEVSFTVLSDRDRWGPEGLAGGQAGGKARYILDPKGQHVELGSKTTIALAADTVFSYRTCGGGGYGPPHRRDPQAVAEDVREGKVSAERARDEYGVVIDSATGQVDQAATEARRREMADDGL